uniref:Large ribosomal subunit protein uL18c n=1 Tax=Cyanoptyche gloeocystis TaxID=77922 RepID=A0A3G1IWM8_9EUKA|nr:ribosomal protein L18 [Cyanoptyche gloeocystis]
MTLTSKKATQRRHLRVRRKVLGTTTRPRLAVFRSHQHIYVQLIDDTQQKTLAASSTVEKIFKEQNISATATCEASAIIGKIIAQKSIEKGIKKVVFDRGGNLYHGRIKALAEAAREAGLDF